MFSSMLPFLRKTCMLPISLLLIGLAACGGGGGGGGSDTSGGGTTPADPPSTLTLQLPQQGLTAAQLGIVVAQGNADSEAIASYYQTARGVPAANIVRVSLPGAGDTISASDFATLKAQVDAQLPAQVQATLLAWGGPSQVVGATCSMSITSAMAFGYNAKYCNVGSSCVATATSPYYDSESRQPWTDLNVRPSMMIGAATLAAAKPLIDRGVSADASYPGGDGWLIRSNDNQRNVRGDDFSSQPAAWAGLLTLNFVDNGSGPDNANTISGRSNVLFYFTGVGSMPDLASNQYRPGAVGDTLTSYAGVLPDGRGQVTVLDWLNAGLTASYGNVEEPCNFQSKFSRASVLIDQYWRGGTLIEAYWKSVQSPGEGLFVGEPLAQPFRDKPSLAIVNGQYQISSRALRSGASYSLQYRIGANGSWVTLGTFTGRHSAAQNLTAPLAPGAATQLRWMGPCPNNSTQQCMLASSS